VETVVQLAVALEERPSAEHIAPIAEAAFDVAVAVTRVIQEVYRQAYSNTTLITKDTIPAVIPVYIDPSDRGSRGIGIHFHDRSLRHLRADSRPQSDTALFFAAALSDRAKPPFGRFVRMRADAMSTLEAQGNYTAAAIMNAAAAEILLDEILLMLLWSEGKSIDEVATTFSERGVVGRVKSEFHTRLGGRWETDRAGAIKNWFDQTVLLRNQAVHFGHSPSRDEVSASARAVMALATFVKGVIGTKTNIRRYPALASSIVPAPKLLAKAKEKPEVLEVYHLRRSKWSEFAEWQSQVSAAMQQRA
jgi:hypothetical protein